MQEIPSLKFPASRPLPFLFSLAAFPLAAFPLAALAAGSGSSPSGAVSSPTMIPVNVGHEVTLTQAGNVVRQCFATGIPSRGVVSVMNRLFARIYPGISPSVARFDGDASLRLPACDPTMGPFPYRIEEMETLADGCPDELSVNGFIRPAYATVTQPQGEVSAPVTGAQPTVPGVRPFMETGYNSSGKLVLRFSVDRTPVPAWSDSSDPSEVSLETAQLPFLQLGRISTLRTFDHWGRPLRTTSLVRGLEIAVPPGGDAEITLTNVDSGAATDVRIDTREYIGCLRSELQRQP